MKPASPTAGTAVALSHHPAEESSAIDPRVLPWVKTQLVLAFKLRRDGLFAVSTGESSEH